MNPNPAEVIHCALAVLVTFLLGMIAGGTLHKLAVATKNETPPVRRVPSPGRQGPSPVSE